MKMNFKNTIRVAAVMMMVLFTGGCAGSNTQKAPTPEEFNIYEAGAMIENIAEMGETGLEGWSRFSYVMFSSGISQEIQFGDKILETKRGLKVGSSYNDFLTAYKDIQFSASLNEGYEGETTQADSMDAFKKAYTSLDEPIATAHINLCLFDGEIVDFETFEYEGTSIYEYGEAFWAEHALQNYSLFINMENDVVTEIYIDYLEK